MTYESNNSSCCIPRENSKWNIFKQMSLYILHLNINSLLPKIYEIRFIAKQSNASAIGISESKLDSSFLNSTLDIENYDLIKLDRSRRRGGVVKKSPILESPYFTTISQDFAVTLKIFL